jgi:hypothetical protein
MKRRHDPREVRLLVQWRKVRDRFFTEDTRPVSRKRHPLDCGHPGCWTCHSDKITGHTPHRQELIADLKFREQTKESH